VRRRKKKKRRRKKSDNEQIARKVDRQVSTSKSGKYL
jgi:hypothetical protein